MTPLKLFTLPREAPPSDSDLRFRPWAPWECRIVLLCDWEKFQLGVGWVVPGDFLRFYRDL